MSQNTAVKTGSVKPVSRKDMSKLQWTWKEMKKYKMGYVMIAPFFILFFIFTVIPVILSMFLSFTSFNLLEWPKWLGFDNYLRLFLDDDIFLIAIKNTLIFAIITGPVSYIMSLFVAWFINELSPRVRAIVTLIFYAPSISGAMYNGTDTVLPGYKLRYAFVYSRCALDVTRRYVPFVYRRSSDSR